MHAHVTTARPTTRGCEQRTRSLPVLLAAPPTRLLLFYHVLRLRGSSRTPTTTHAARGGATQGGAPKSAGNQVRTRVQVPYGGLSETEEAVMSPFKQKKRVLKRNPNALRETEAEGGIKINDLGGPKWIRPKPFRA